LYFQAQRSRLVAASQEKANDQEIWDYSLGLHILSRWAKQMEINNHLIL
jgi:hypothetical protein